MNKYTVRKSGLFFVWEKRSPRRGPAWDEPPKRRLRRMKRGGEMKKQGEMRTAVSSATMFLMGLAVFAIQLKGSSDEQIHSSQKRAVLMIWFIVKSQKVWHNVICTVVFSPLNQRFVDFS